MSAESYLIRLATARAEERKSRKAELEEEKVDLERRLTEINALLDEANLSAKRVYSFEPVTGGELQCPKCWIDKEVKSPMRPKAGESADDDVFTCRSCGNRLVISYK